MVMRMAMNDSYMRYCENVDYGMLMDFNQIMGWFTTIKETEERSKTDAVAVDKKGRKWHIELKGRPDTYQYKGGKISNGRTVYTGFYIKEHKYKTLVKKLEEGYVAAYWNFFSEGNQCWIANAEDLKRLVEQRLILPENIPVKSKGKQEMEYNLMYDLPFSIGTFYHKKNGRWYEGLY